MIHLVIPSKRKPLNNWSQKHSHYPVVKTVNVVSKDVLDSNACFGELFQEILKRNALLQAMLKDCTFKVGDILTPADEEELKTQGDSCEVLAIWHNLSMYEPDWPKDNLPYSMKFKSQKTGKVFYCNPSYFKEHNEQVSSGV